MQIEISEHAYNEMISALTSGLHYSNWEHKQYFLEKALGHLVGPDALADLKEREDWDNGIPA